MNCKCGNTLVGREIAVGKCLFCVIKSFKWSLARLHKEVEKKNAEIADLRVKLLIKFRDADKYRYVEEVS